jgi:hypothetical protein
MTGKKKRKEKKRKPTIVGKYDKNCAILSIASSTHMCWTSIVATLGV